MRSLLLPLLGAAGRLLLIVLPLLAASPVLAQTDVRIQLHVSQLSWALPTKDGEVEPAFTIFYDSFDNSKRFFCQTYKESGKSKDKYVNLFGSFVRSTGSSAFTLCFQGHENDRDTNCDFDRNDEYRQQVYRFFDMRNQAPGVYSAPITVTLGYYTFIYRWRYTLPTPAFLTCAGCNTTENVCANNAMTLTTNVDLPRKDGLQYVWEYHVSGDDNYMTNPDYTSCLQSCQDMMDGDYCYNSCYQQYADNMYVSEPIWRPLAVTDAPSFPFTPGEKIPGLTTNKTVDFRVRVKSSEMESLNRQSNGFMFSPPAPKVTSVTSTPSCPVGTTADGTIVVSGISGLGMYKYILREGPDDLDYCDPGKGTCLRLAQMSKPSGSFSGSSFVLREVPPGQYTLWITNPGAEYGVCAFKQTIGVDQIPALNLTSPVITHNTCYGASEGSITIASSGGRPNIVCTLKNAQGQVFGPQTFNAIGTPATFNGLAAGVYEVVVEDACKQSATTSIEVEQPAQLIVTQPLPLITDATCANPGNGQARITFAATDGASDISPSGTYLYQLYKDDQPFGDAVQSTDLVWTRTDLPVCDNYRLRVKDAAGLDCNGATFSFKIIGPATMQVGTPQVTPVTCYGGSNGAISVTGNNGLDTPFRYLLTKDGVAPQENRTGTFTNLAAGTYTITQMRTIDGCTDASISAPIVITQPAVLSINYTKLNVSCYDQKNGRITASVTGGTGPYAYQWQRLLSGDAALDDNWSGLSGQVNPTLPNLEPGTYRLRVRDAHSCLVVSPAISITEPALLEITTVNVHDITCFGEKGTLEPLVRGGTAPYTLEYTTNNGGTYAAFTAATPLLPGTYRVRVTDRNGCRAGYDAPLMITAPPAALSFTYTLSDYNGYHVSCFGGSNGTATLAATGGNGDGYAGYTYALDNGAYQDDAILTGITAGTHTLRVKDARGCVVSQTVTFTQPDAALFLTLSDKTDILCYGEATGELTVSVTGGTAPYQFSRDGVAFQADPHFTGLAAGDYVITVRDVNGCSTALPVRLLHLHAPIVITASITNVSCYDGNDGRIEITAGGGAGGYQYAWTSLAQTGASAGNLKIGTYPLGITDASGCRKDTLFTIGQPDAPLSVYVHNTPVCADRSNGVIDLSPRGGTPPYRHSIDNGLSFQPGNRFLVGVGTYPIVVQDSQGCTVTATTTIVQRNDRPEPNFLIATRQNAFDTLVVKETSLPKADSVHWSFDPRALVIDADPYSPKIRFTDPGTYLVTMTGYFGGCDYSLTKTLTLSPFDPVAVAPLAANTALIRELAVTPNPNNGRFSFTVKLARTQPLSVVVVDVLGNEYYRKSWGQTTEVTENLQLERAASGFYILRAIVPTDAKETRVLLNKQ